MFNKQIRIPDKKYLDFVRELPCLICLMESEGDMNTEHSRSEPHHVNKVGNSGVAMKADDSRCVPFCNAHHRECHLMGRDTFTEKYNIDMEHAVEQINRIWEEKNACSNIN